MSVWRQRRPGKSGAPASDSTGSRGLTPLTSSPSPRANQAFAVGCGERTATSRLQSNRQRTSSRGLASGSTLLQRPRSQRFVCRAENRPEPGEFAGGVDTHRVHRVIRCHLLPKRTTAIRSTRRFSATQTLTSEVEHVASRSVVKIPPLPSDADARTAGASRTDKSATDGRPARPTEALLHSQIRRQLLQYRQVPTRERIAVKELLSLNSKLVRGDPTALQPGRNSSCRIMTDACLVSKQLPALNAGL